MLKLIIGQIMESKITKKNIKIFDANVETREILKIIINNIFDLSPIMNHILKILKLLNEEYKFSLNYDLTSELLSKQNVDIFCENISSDNLIPNL